MIGNRVVMAVPKKRPPLWRLIATFGTFCVVLTATSLAYAASPTITLSMEPEQARVGDEITLTVEASGELDSVEPPSSPFQLRSAGQSTSMSIVNGRTTTRVRFQYVFRADRVGSHTIGPAVALSRGRPVAETRALQLKVREALSLEPLRPGEQNVRDYEGKAAFVLTQVAKGEVVVGEPLRVNIDLYFRRGYPVTGYDFIRPPGFQGFKKESLFTGREDRRRLKREVRIGSTAYVVIPLERAILIPLSKGLRVVGDLELKLEVQSGFRRSSKRVLAQPVQIKVISLAKPSPPKGFVPGVVGRFTLKGGPDRTTARVGERILLDLTIAGEGNIDAIEPPTTPEVKGLRVEAIPGRDCPERELSEKGYRGSCRFQTILYPEEVGTIELGPIRFVYLDPGKRTYQTLKLGPWTLTIEGSKNARAFVPGPEPEPGIDLSETLEPGFLDRMPSGGSGRELPRPPSPWLALGGPMAFLLGLSMMGRMRRKRAEDPKRAIRRIVARAVRDLKNVRTSDRGMVSEVVAQSMRRTLIALIATDPQGLASEGLRRHLEANHIQPELSADILQIWEEAEKLRYGGATDTVVLRDHALQVIHDLSEGAR